MHSTLTGHRVMHARRPGLAAFIAHAFAVWRQRQKLGALDSHLRRDIGLSEQDIRTEAARPLWDVPAYWLR